MDKSEITGVLKRNSFVFTDGETPGQPFALRPTG
jgi:hypothetical protein